MKKFLLLFLVFLFGNLSAQVGERYSEDDISIHGKFVKASQKKLLRKYDDAISIYESILEKDMHNAVALFDLSRIYMMQDKEDKAIEYGEKALKKDKQNDWYKESLAEIKMKFKHYEDAAAIYTQLAYSKQTNHDLYFKAIEANTKANKKKSNIAIFEKMENVFGPDSYTCLLYTSPSPRDRQKSRMPSSA